MRHISGPALRRGLWRHYNSLAALALMAVRRESIYGAAESVAAAQAGKFAGGDEETYR